MPLLNTASKLYVGGTAATAVYRGATKVWGSTQSTITTVEFTGTVGATIPTGNGVLQVVGAPTYQPGFNGTGAQTLVDNYVIADSPTGNWSGSAYITVNALPTSGASRLVLIRDAGAGWLAAVRLQPTGVFQYMNEVAVGGDFVGLTGVPSQTYRIDWQVNPTAKTVQWRVTPIGGATYSATSTWTTANAPAVGVAFSGGGAGAGTNTVVDTYRYDVGLSWLPPVVTGFPEIVSSAQAYGGTGATASFPRPANVAAGDYLVAAIRSQSSGNGPDFTAPAGWERIGAPYMTLTSTIRYNAWFGHRITDLASEPASYTFTNVPPHTGGRWVGGIIGVRNVANGPVGGGSVFQASGNTSAATPAVNAPEDSLVLGFFATETGAANSGAMAGVPAGWTRRIDAVGPVSDGSASATWLNVFSRVFTVATVDVSAATPFTGPTLSAPACGALVINGTGTPATSKVWTENWESWPLGVMAVTPPVTAVSGGPTIVTGFDGKAAESGPTSRKVTVSVAGMAHWSLDFTVRMSGTITANNYVASVVDSAGAYVGELSLRLTEKQIWNRINFGADTKGKSVWTYAVDPSTIRIVYEWHDDEYLKCHLFYGTNLAGIVPNETLVYDKTMVSGILIGKRVEGVRFGNDTTTGVVQQFDNITLRNLE